MIITALNIEAELNNTSWQLSSMSINSETLTPTREEVIDFGVFTVAENVEGAMDMHGDCGTLPGLFTAGIKEDNNLTNIKFISGKAQQKYSNLSILGGVLTIKFNDGYSQNYTQII